MARAGQELDPKDSLYESDFQLWIDQQLRLLKDKEFEELDLPNLIEELEDMGRGQKQAIRSDLTVLLTHLLKYQFQPEGRSTSWTGSIAEHRQRILDEIEDSPSLRSFPSQIFERSYEKARIKAAAERGLSEDAFPAHSPWTPDQVLQLRFLPD